MVVVVVVVVEFCHDVARSSPGPLDWERGLTVYIILISYERTTGHLLAGRSHRKFKLQTCLNLLYLPFVFTLLLQFRFHFLILCYFNLDFFVLFLFIFIHLFYSFLCYFYFSLVVT